MGFPQALSPVLPHVAHPPRSKSRVVRAKSETVNLNPTRYYGKSDRPQIEVWQFNRQVAQIKPKSLLRIQCERAFKLRWSANEWQEITETDSLSTNLRIEYVDISLSAKQESIY